MLDTLLTSQVLNAILTLGILAAAMYSFVREKIPPDVTALLVIVALLASGILTPSEAFSGFSHPATISVAAVLVLSAGIERTGALAFLARRVLAPFGRSEFLLAAVIMLAIGVLSAFINNTAAVAVFIPVVIDVCRRTGTAPGRILMPMAHAATFGGMCTLVGTSTNLVAHEFARSQGLDGFGMFELGKVGLPLFLAGSAYLLLVARASLPRVVPGDAATFEPSREYLSELVVTPRSPWIGREVQPDHMFGSFQVELVALVRGEQVLDPHAANLRYAAGDLLRVRGNLEPVLKLVTRLGLEWHRPQRAEKLGDAAATDTGGAAVRSPASATVSAPEEVGVQLPLAEVVVLSTSGLIGRTLEESRFSERYDVLVLALCRRADFRERPTTTPLHAGDLLVVEGTPEALRALADKRGFLFVGAPTRPEQRPAKLLTSLATFVAVIMVVSLGFAPIVTAATAGCAVLMLTGCLRPREAYRAIDLSLVFLLAGSLALGTALEKTGVAAQLATGLAGLTRVTSPYVVVVGFFLVAVLISEFMSNSGTVALLGPIALTCAAQMHVNPMSLLAAVALGASAAFAMPIGYQTSLMVYGPGGYRMRDFVRTGLPLDILLTVIALVLIPRFWPLVPR